MICCQLSEASFEPPAIKAITAAYELALSELQVTDRSTPITDRVAETVLLVYRAGYVTPEAICKRTLKALRVDL